MIHQALPAYMMPLASTVALRPSSYSSCAEISPGPPRALPAAAAVTRAGCPKSHWTKSKSKVISSRGLAIVFLVIGSVSAEVRAEPICGDAQDPSKFSRLGDSMYVLVGYNRADQEADQENLLRCARGLDHGIGVFQPKCEWRLAEDVFSPPESGHHVFAVIDESPPRCRARACGLVRSEKAGHASEVPGSVCWSLIVPRLFEQPAF